MDRPGELCRFFNGLNKHASLVKCYKKVRVVMIDYVICNKLKDTKQRAHIHLFPNKIPCRYTNALSLVRNSDQVPISTAFVENPCALQKISIESIIDVSK